MEEMLLNKSLDKGREKLSQRSTLALFVLSSVVLQGLLFFGMLLLLGIYLFLARKPPPSLVQMAGGESITVAPVGSKDRTPKVIRQFTINTLTTMMTWTGELSAPLGEKQIRKQLDPGVVIPLTSNKQAKVTTAAWESAFALSEDFRQEFLQKLGELTPQSVFKGGTDVVFVPLNVGEPQLIDEGKWKIIVVANLMIFEGNNYLGEVIPFQKEIFIRAVEPPHFLTIEETGNAVAGIVAQVRASGLEIYGIRDYKQENL